MIDRVVCCDIIRQFFLSLFLEYVEMILSYYVSDSIASHAYFSGSFCFAVTLTMIFAALFSVSTSVGCCGWRISARDVLMDVNFWKISNNTPNSASVDYAISFIVMMHSTCCSIPGGCYTGRVAPY